MPSTGGTVGTRRLPVRKTPGPMSIQLIRRLLRICVLLVLRLRRPR